MVHDSVNGWWGVVDPEELAVILSGTMLGGRPVVVAQSPTLAVRCGPDELWPAWQAARSVVESTGRWPVLVASFGDPDDPPWAYSLDEDPEEATVRAVIDAATKTNPWTMFNNYGVDDVLDADDLELWLTEDPLFAAEDLPRLLAAGTTQGQLERDRLDRWISSAGVPPERVDLGEGRSSRERVWFTPVGQPCAVVFLAAATSWEAGARLSYFGALAPEEQAALAAAEHEWADRYGAELVASWGTMRQYVVTRRPTTVEQAWELAGQHLAVGSSIQTRQSELALALMQSDYWFLHDRP